MSLWQIYFKTTLASNCLIIKKFDVHPSYSLQDIRQYQWTMKYRSLWPAFIFRSKVVSHWLIIQIHQIVFEISGKIPGLWNVGHSHLHLFWGQQLYHTNSLSKSLMFINQKVFMMSGKINGPWNVRHCQLHLFWGQRLHNIDALSKLLFLLIK